MAIRIRHDAAGIAVNPESLRRTGGGNTRLGSGKNLLLQREKFAQDNFQRMQDRMFDVGRMRLANQFQIDRDKRMIQADQDMLKARQEAENKQFMDRRKLQQEDLDAAIQRDMIGQTTANLEDQISGIRGAMSKQNYTAEGKKVYQDLVGALRGIESQRDSLRPKQYNELLNKWLENFEKSGLQDFVAPPPTIHDELDTRFKDLGNGQAVFLQPDGRFDVKEIDKRDTKSMSAADYFSDKSNYEQAKKVALQTLQERYLADNPNAMSPGKFDAAAIHEEMLKEFNDYQSFLQGMQPAGDGQEPGQAPAQGGQQGVAGAPTQPAPTQPAPTQPPPTPAAPTQPIPSPDKQFEQHLADEAGVAAEPNPYIQLSENEAPGGPSAPASPADLPADSPAVTEVKADFESAFAAAPDLEAKGQLAQLRSIHAMNEGKPEIRNAIAVLVNPDSNSQDTLRAVAILKKNGIDIEQELQPKDEGPPKFSGAAVPIM